MKNQKIFGIVEGFFSDPLPVWTPEERLYTLKFIVTNAKKINTYFYCPKDDPFVVKHWYKQYPKKNLQALREIIEFCNQNNIRFVYGLNPSQDILQEDNKTSVDRILEKLQQLQNIGCQNFCLLFDDIPLAYDVLDQQDAQKQTIQIETLLVLVNIVYERTRDTIDTMWFCSPDYCFTKETIFTKALQKLNGNITILWSGNEVFAKTITQKDVNRVEKLLPDKTFVWWSNYPVNDCEQNVGMFNFGPFYGVNKEVLENISGIIVNPMREVYLNFPFYMTFAEFIDKSEEYNKKNAWENALKQMFGKNWKKCLLLLGILGQSNNSYKNILSYPSLLKRYTALCSLLQKKSWNNNNRWTLLFFEDLKSFIPNAYQYIELQQQILVYNSIDQTIFNTYDIFPTRTTVPRYYGEIYKIVQKRIALLGVSKETLQKLQYFENIYQKFEKNFIGHKKLQMTTKDKTFFLQTIRKIVILEQNLFIQKMQDKEISPKRKLVLFAKRQNINRFTYKF